MKALRKELGLNNRQMAQLLGTKLSTYGMAEGHLRSLPDEASKKLLELNAAFSVTSKGSINDKYKSHIQNKLSDAKNMASPGRCSILNTLLNGKCINWKK